MIERALAAAAFALAAGCGGPPPEPAPPPAEAPDGRLSETARPLAYDVELTIDPAAARFTGDVAIEVEFDAEAPGLWLHGDDLTVDEASVETADGQTLAAAYTEVLPSGVSWIGFSEPVAPGAHTVKIEYSAAFDPLLAGLFSVNRGGADYALAKSESIQARRFLPSFDEPGFKAPFEITLIAPDGLKAVSNAPLASATPADRDGFTAFRFEPTRPLSTYLLAVSVGPFDQVDRPDLPANDVRDRPVPLRGFARAGKGAQLERVLDATQPMLELFERDLQQPYPYQKLDVVAAPDWPSGATELAGAITYREPNILLSDDPAPGALRGMMSIHAHELAHMWFGNLVTPPWWNDLWLKEAFATWGSNEIMRRLEPDMGWEVDAVVDGISAMKLDSLPAARSINEPISRNDDIRNAYDRITYRKGAAVIAMVDSYFGAERFRPALGRYVAAFADGAADSEDFYAVIGDVSGEPLLTEVFRSFVDQNGLPLVSAALSCEVDGDAPAELALSQSRYTPLGVDSEPREWTIPVCVSLGSAEGETSKACHLLDGPAATVPLDVCPDWVAPNAGATGYYRWNLDPEGWTALSEAFGALPETEAISALDSAAAAFAADEIDAGALVRLLDAAAASPDRWVIESALIVVEELKPILDEGAAAQLDARARAWFSPRLEDPDEELRASVSKFLADVAGDEAVERDLASAADQYLSSGGSEGDLSSDFYGAAFRAFVRKSGSVGVERLIDAREEIDDAAFIPASAAALGAVEDPESVQRVLDYALSDAVGTRDAFVIISELMAQPTTRQAAWDWVRSDFDAVLAKVPRQWARRTPAFASAFCDLSRIGELDAFYAEVGDNVPGHERALNQTRQEIARCAAFKDAKAAELAAALNADQAG